MHIVACINNGQCAEMFNTCLCLKLYIALSTTIFFLNFNVLM